MPTRREVKSIGLIGFGAFARLAARLLRAHFTVLAYDPTPQAPADGVEFVDLAAAAGCDAVVLATPVAHLGEAVAAVGPHLKPGALGMDVGSVKSAPAALMLAGLPANVDIVGAHPLFGPQSAAEGVRGHKIAICPLRGASGWRAAAFLRRTLGLHVFITTPEAHDREAALVQGLTHFIARVLVQMEPLPERLTTKSYDMLRQAVEMVRYDSAAVFDAIERENPYSAEARSKFLALAKELDQALSKPR